MKTAKLVAPSLLVLLLLAVGVPAASSSGQRPPEPVAQPTPAATPAPTPAPQVRPEEKDKQESKEKKWNVETPPYPMPVEAAIDTDEGTWMSLDVSPDGK